MSQAIVAASVRTVGASMTLPTCVTGPKKFCAAVQLLVLEALAITRRRDLAHVPFVSVQMIREGLERVRREITDSESRAIRMHHGLGAGRIEIEGDGSRCVGIEDEAVDLQAIGEDLDELIGRDRVVIGACCRAKPLGNTCELRVGRHAGIDDIGAIAAQDLGVAAQQRDAESDQRP